MGAANANHRERDETATSLVEHAGMDGEFEGTGARGEAGGITPHSFSKHGSKLFMSDGAGLHT